MEKHYAVIGDPIDHSLSPWMHKAGYEALEIAAEYQRFRVQPGQLAEAVEGLCALGYSGWNVTLPFKERIIPFLDRLTPEAQRAGAVNTVKIQDGLKIGHNTDGAGFVRSVQGYLKELNGKKAVLLGAGGAAKGIALALAERGMKLQILNRTKAKAEELVGLIEQGEGTAASGEFAAGDWHLDADLIVQTTSVGLHDEPFPFSLEGISGHTLVADIIVTPQDTPFLREAQKLGCTTLNGLDMLLYQGTLAWEFWLGGQAPVEEMKQALQKQLAEQMFAKG